MFPKLLPRAARPFPIMFPKLLPRTAVCAQSGARFHILCNDLRRVTAKEKSKQRFAQSNCEREKQANVADSLRKGNAHALADTESIVAEGWNVDIVNVVAQH